MEYIWVLVPYMTYDIYVMYLCHWHKSQEKGVAEEKHSLASVRSFLLRERLMVTHHLFILIVLTPVAQVRAGHGRCAPRSPVGVSLGVTADGCITAGPSLAQRASFPASPPAATPALLSPDVPALEHGRVSPRPAPCSQTGQRPPHALKAPHGGGSPPGWSPEPKEMLGVKSNPTLLKPVGPSAGP